MFTAAFGLALPTGVAGCGSGSSSGSTTVVARTPAIGTVNVTGTSGLLKKDSTVAVTVN